MISVRPTPLERATTLAFAGDLRAAAMALDGASYSRTHPEAQRARWLRAYLLTANGDFARAERLARRVLGEARDRAEAARAAVTLGSILRQTGRHGEARAVEIAALRRAPTAELRAHLRIGLAADAVGLGELLAVDRELAHASSIRTRDWRVNVRLRWVRCERELLAGRPSHAARWARSAASIATRAGARRHVAKSLLFLGAAAHQVAATSTGTRGARAADVSERSLRRARDVAAAIGARPIERVAGELLGPSRERG